MSENNLQVTRDKNSNPLHPNLSKMIVETMSLIVERSKQLKVGDFVNYSLPNNKVGLAKITEVVRSGPVTINSADNMYLATKDRPVYILQQITRNESGEPRYSESRFARISKDIKLADNL